MVRRLFRRAAPAAAILFALFALAAGLFLAGCDFIGASIFPSYLMSSERVTSFQEHTIPGTSYRKDYDIWVKSVIGASGRKYVVLGIDYWRDDIHADSFLVFSGDLKFLRYVDRNNVYGDGNYYNAARFAAPGPDPAAELMVGFYGPTEPLVALDPYVFDRLDPNFAVRKPDALNLLNTYRLDSSIGLNNSVYVPATGSTWFFRSDYYSNTYYRDSLTAAYVAGGSGTGSIFTTGLQNTAGIFYGAALLADSTVAVFFRGNWTGGGYVASSPDPGALPLPFASDDTPIGNLPDEYNKHIFFTRDGLVVAGWDDDWKIYRLNGKVETGPPEEDREDLTWTFSPDGGAYYIADGRESRLVKARPWW